MGWFEKRFDEDSTKHRLNCVICNKPMWFPKSKYGLYKTCGGKCSDEKAKANKENLKRNCIKCGKIFYPRLQQVKAGNGFYCSQKCNTAKNELAHTPEAIKKRVQSFKETMAVNGYKRGQDHPRWAGGSKATYERRKISGKIKETLKKYRSKNPEKVKEWSQKRSAGKTGRLPKGFIAWLKEQQKNLCVICSQNLPDNYHVDHIYPISKGGKHEPQNIQLLCPSCNVKKAAKDPIEYMQSVGYLI